MVRKCRIFSMMIIFIIGCNNDPNNKVALDLIQGLPSVHNDRDPGYAILMTSWDSTVMESYYGVEDITTRKAISAQSLFNIGSISKTFVAYAILNLAQEGKLSLTDSLIKFFPKFKNPAIGNQVRIYHLLTHTSGLPDNRPVTEDSIYYLTADDAQNWAPILQNDSLYFTPGSQYEYSNPAFNALALIIQQVTNIKWQDYIRIKIFSPAELKTSTITDGSYPDSGVAHAYLPLSNGQWQERDYGEEPTFNAAGNGGVWSSARELSKYEQAIQRIEFVSPEAKLLSRTIFPLPMWKSATPSLLGLSWFVSDYQGHAKFAHTGSQGGFTADYVSIPTAGFFYCILSNTPIEVLKTREKVLAYATEHGWIRTSK